MDPSYPRPAKSPIRADAAGDRLISLRAVLARVGLSRATLDRYERAGLFPRRVKLIGRVFWSERQIDGWIADKLREAQGRSTGEAPHK